MSNAKHIPTSHLLGWLPEKDALQVLEIGFGSPEQAMHVRALKNLSEYVGVDLDEEAVRQAKAQWAQATFICGDAAGLASQYSGYFDTVIIRRPDLFARPQNWMQVFATLPTLINAEGRIVVTTIGAAEANTARTWLASSNLIILHAEERLSETEAFLLVAKRGSEDDLQPNLSRLDILEGEGMYCDPITGICYLPHVGELNDKRQS